MQKDTNYSHELIISHKVRNTAEGIQHASTTYINLLVCIGPLSSCSLVNYSQTRYNYHVGNPVGWQT